LLLANKMVTEAEWQITAALKLKHLSPYLQHGQYKRRKNILPTGRNKIAGSFFFSPCLLISSTSVVCALSPSVKGSADVSFQTQFFCNFHQQNPLKNQCLPHLSSENCEIKILLNLIHLGLSNHTKNAPKFQNSHQF
jgi:hypothetical protein